MKKKYVIKKIETNEYYYQYDGDNGFLATVEHCKTFDSEIDCVYTMNEHPWLFTDIYEIVPIYLKLI